MIKKLITATLMATMPINNTTANTNRYIYLNTYTPLEYVTGNWEGLKYLVKPTNNVNDLGILQTTINSYDDQKLNTQTNVFVNEFVLGLKIENVNETNTNSVNINLTSQFNLQYNENLIITCSYDLYAIVGGEYENENYIDEFLTTTDINNLDTDVISSVLDELNEYNVEDSIFISNIQYSGQTAINKWKNNEEQTINTVIDSNNYIYVLIYGYVSYNTQDQIINYNPTIKTYNPIQINYNWNVPAQTGEIVDIPGLLFSIIGMPFAFISQAFNLTIFPGTIYEVNISHIFLAIIITGILLFILKKVFR